MQETKSETAELIKTYIKEGKIVPVAITVGLLKKAILEHHARGRSYFLVDGFPRNKDNLDGWNAVMTGVANVRFCIMFGRATLLPLLPHLLHAARFDPSILIGVCVWGARLCRLS